MSNNNSNNTNDLGNSMISGSTTFTGLLSIAFIVLKLCGVINWSWVWVLAPIWIPIVVVLIIVLIVVILALCKVKKN